MKQYKPLKGQDDMGGFVYSCIVNDLANLAGDAGFEDIKNELQEAEFIMAHLPKEDGGPDWEGDIFKEIVDVAPTGNCLDVPWL